MNLIPNKDSERRPGEGDASEVGSFRRSLAAALEAAA